MVRARVRGAGSVYQRPDGYWAAAISLPPRDGKRHRKVVVAKSREVAELRLAELLEERGGPPTREPRNRTEYMDAARALGTHRPEELAALIDATTECRYCTVTLSRVNRVVDHIVPISRGGSDAIDNLQVICWECNAGKSDGLEYEWDGPPRSVKQAPWGRPYEPLDPKIARRVLERLRRGY